jgi:hypothetical protein
MYLKGKIMPKREDFKCKHCNNGRILFERCDECNGTGINWQSYAEWSENNWSELKSWIGKIYESELEVNLSNVQKLDFIADLRVKMQSIELKD